MRYLLLIILSLCTPFSLFLNAQILDLGVISRDALAAKAVPILVSSNDARVQTIVQRLFALHGAFRLSNKAEEVQHRVDFAVNEEKSLSVTVFNAQNQPTATLQSSGGVSAPNLMRVSDAIVAKLTGTEGFFSGKMAFISDRSGSYELYVSDLLLDSVKQLTSDKANCLGPSLSPDGRSVLYTTYFRNGFPDVYKVDLATGKRTLFAGFKGTNTGATWSAQGDRVAMILSAKGNAEIFIADTQGKIVQRLTHTLKGLESDPAWSPDGRELVFASDLPGKPQIYRQALNATKLSRVPTQISGYCAEPDWNPINPDLIAFTVATGGQFEVALYSFSKNESTILSRGDGDCVQPEWLPDGRHILCTERTSAYRRLIVLDSQSGRSSPLHSQRWGNSSQGSFVRP
jgi:TolB protein